MKERRSKKERRKESHVEKKTTSVYHSCPKWEGAPKAILCHFYAKGGVDFSIRRCVDGASIPMPQVLIYAPPITNPHCPQEPLDWSSLKL